jgi:hypothetical protein
MPFDDLRQAVTPVTRKLVPPPHSQSMTSGIALRDPRERTMTLVKVLTIARNAARPAYFPVMAHKAYLRARYGTSGERRAATRWAAERCEDLATWAREIDSPLWDEAVGFADDLKAVVQSRLDELSRLGIDLGGGGCYELLYFLARLRRPKTVLETGVAAGWSTTAILSALRKNGEGYLYSSDFPYFRLPQPERFVGYLVPDDLKERWTIHLKGDRRNLDAILTPGVTVDLVHYDSDKSRSGREFFIERISRHLAPGVVLVMDDINDDLFFRDYVESQSGFRVFEYYGKYLGVVGL